jgi:hypothetical protein
MSVTVQICTELRSGYDASESWITDQINRRRRDGAAVCVVVMVQSSGVDLKLTTPACGSGGGGRLPTVANRRLLPSGMNEI